MARALLPLLVVAVLLLVLALRLRRQQPAAPGGERIDPMVLADPWRSFVHEALQAEHRFTEAVRRVPPGPLQERLGGIGVRLHDGVRECWEIASRADGMQHAVAAVDVRAKEADLARLQRELEVGGGNDSLERAAESMRGQLASAARMEAAVWDARDKLRLLDARLGEAVTRAAELSLRRPGDAELGALGHDVDDVVVEMEALRSALEDTRGG